MPDKDTLTKRKNELQNTLDELNGEIDILREKKMPILLELAEIESQIAPDPNPEKDEEEDPEE